jgi:protein ImuB
MPRVLQTLDLFPQEPVQAPALESRPAQQKSQLWLAAHLPRLALECLVEEPSSSPVVVVESGGRSEVVVCNELAREAGIVAGMRLGTALTLAAHLVVLERDSTRELAALERLAASGETLTSMVSVEPPDGVLLEISGSLKLFGSLDNIKARLREELSLRHRGFSLCAALTPTAAVWLARGCAGDVSSWGALGGSVGALPLAVTRWPSAVQALLRDLGVRTLGDCVRLPREGFARRIGRQYLQELDRAFGRQHDLRAPFSAPRSWSAKLELPAESVDGGLLLAASEQLVDELVQELGRCQAQIGTFDLVYEHLQHPPTVEHFALLEPSYERERFLLLIGDRLERRVLPVPVCALALNSGVFEPLERKEQSLFERKPLEDRVQSLLERLRLEFGAAAVHGLQAVAEHRPERAWSKRADLAERASLRAAAQVDNSRPLWLLPEPVPLTSRHSNDRAGEGLELCSGPERIESGWWDGQQVGRDYYTARNSTGQKLWVFRDRLTASWYLHGLFG